LTAGEILLSTLKRFFTVFSGVSFDTSLQDLISQIPVAMQVFANGVEAFVTDPENENNVRQVFKFKKNAGNAFISLFHSQTMHIKSFYTQPHC
jgi:hypothetical protein